MYLCIVSITNDAKASVWVSSSSSSAILLLNLSIEWSGDSLESSKCVPFNLSLSSRCDKDRHVMWHTRELNQELNRGLGWLGSFRGLWSLEGLGGFRGLWSLGGLGGFRELGSLGGFQGPTTQSIVVLLGCSGQGKDGKKGDEKGDKLHGCLYGVTLFCNRIVAILCCDDWSKLWSMRSVWL